MADAVLHQPIIMTRRHNITIGDDTRVDGFVKLEGGIGLWIGRGVHIASFAHIGVGGGETVIEDYATISSGGKVISGSHKVDGLSMSVTAPATMQSIERLKTRVCRYAWVCSNAVVLAGVTLGEGAVLAAGAVATQDVPPWEVWAGLPARFLARRVVR